MATEKSKSGLSSLNLQHEYITLKCPNGNFTTSFGGITASGALASNKEAFDKLDAHVKNFTGNKGDAMRSLLNEELLTTLWPDWNKKTTIKIGIGDIVSIKGMPKYKDGKVEKLNTKNAKVRFGTSLVSVPYDMIQD